MLKESLIEFYERDLNKLKEEISLYKDETAIWKVSEGISNSAGNLALHIIGNLNHFVGATLGYTGYVRDRDKEFAQKDVPKAELIIGLENTLTMLKTTLSNLSEHDMGKTFPLAIQNKSASTAHMLLHLLVHLDYHLGQVNYHRRILG